MPRSAASFMDNSLNAILIRPMHRTDLPEVVAIEGLCHDHPWSEALFLRELENPVARIDIGELNGRIAGFLCSWTVAGEVEIQDVATAPSFRRQGVAAALLEHLLARGRGEGAARIVLEVRVGNVSAIALYRRFGFRGTGRRKKYYPDGEDALLMELSPLTGSAAATR